MTSPLIRRLAGLVLMGIALAPAATIAADAALMVPIGYSENLRYFAFEEFGIEDGSGFAYSSIYMIDIAEDRWVVGTPVREVADSEDETLSAIRTEARASAEPRLTDLGINVPAELLVAVGDGDADRDGKALGFGLPAPGRPGIRDPRFDLSLEQYTTGAGSPCLDWFGEEPVGFALALASTGISQQVHRDDVLPRSRGCPVDYRLHALFVPFGASDIAAAVVLLSIHLHGYEGLDRRFLALSLNPPKDR